MARSIQSLMDMRGRTALVTGACGGIGREMCDALAEAGATLVAVDRDDAALARLAESIRTRTSATVHPLRLDLEDEAARNDLPARVKAFTGRLDVLVNNAAFVGDSNLQGWGVPFEDQRIDTWRRAIEVNLTACFHVSQRLATLLRASGHGSIVNVSSIYGVVGPDLSLYDGTKMGNPAAYAASKGGLVQMTRWLSTVLAPDVRVNCMSPGGVFRGQPEAFVGRYTKKVPLGRMATEEDFKGALLFLASDLSAYVTGQNVMVDGGFTAW